MFRKILALFFPESETQSELSPIKFHLKLIVPKLYYGLSLKSSLTNRRTNLVDAQLSYFVPADIKFQDSKKENFFYSYKNYALLNGYDNYSLWIILSVVSLVAFVRYFSYLPTEKFLNYLKPLLFAINYVLLMFFAHFKVYDETLTKDERLKFILKLVDEVVFYLEYTKDVKKDYEWAKKMAQEVVEILKQDMDFLMFLYKITEDLSKIYKNKNYNDLVLYEYLICGMLMDFPNEDEFKWILNQTTKKIYAKRFTLYLDADIITLSNIIWGEAIHINYLTSKQNEEFLPYFAESLDHIWDINLLEASLVEVIDKVLDFKLWGENLILALKEFNSDYVDIVVSPDMSFQQVQELLSKSMMDSVKKVSMVNEQFLDYFVLLISKRLNKEWDNFQWELKDYRKIIAKSIDLVIPKDAEKELRQNYVFLDKNYFKWWYFYRTKKLIDQPKHFYFFYDSVVKANFIDQHRKLILEEFTWKTLTLTIDLPEYKNLFKKYFRQDVEELLAEDGHKKYLKYFYPILINYKFPSQQLVNFRKNIYYPDFLVFYKFLKKLDYKVEYADLITFSLIKQTLWGYLIAKKLVKNEIYLENLWKSAIFFYKYDEKIETVLDEFDELDEFVDFFAKVKQNKEFVLLCEEILPSLPENHKKWFVLDSLKDITLYNKRSFKW